MLIYYIAAIFFWVFAGIDLKKNANCRLTGLLALFLFVAIAGLRYQTGYDWLVYEKCFSYIPEILVLLTKWVVVPSPQPHMEPLFYVIVSLLKSLNLGIQTLYLLTALFNGFCIYKFVRWTRTSVAFSMAFYFCWVYLPVQMGVMRQSIAISFMLLAIMAFFNQKKKSAVILFFLGVGFQCSLLMFLPLFFVRIFHKLLKNSVFIALLLLIIYFMKVDFTELLLRIGAMINVGFISNKLGIYQKIGVTNSTSIASMCYLFFNVGLFLYFTRQRSEVCEPVEIFLLSSMLLTIFFQTFFWNLPLFWNRIQYFSVLSQSVMLARCWEKSFFSQIFMSFCTMLVASITVFSYFMFSNGAIPYIPYESYVMYRVTGNEGTGLIRTNKFEMMTQMSFTRLNKSDN